MSERVVNAPDDQIHESEAFVGEYASSWIHHLRWLERLVRDPAGVGEIQVNKPETESGGVSASKKPPTNPGNVGNGVDVGPSSA